MAERLIPQLRGGALPPKEHLCPLAGMNDILTQLQDEMNCYLKCYWVDTAAGITKLFEDILDAQRILQPIVNELRVIEDEYKAADPPKTPQQLKSLFEVVIRCSSICVAIETLFDRALEKGVFHAADQIQLKEMNKILNGMLERVEPAVWTKVGYADYEVEAPPPPPAPSPASVPKAACGLDQLIEQEHRDKRDLLKLRLQVLDSLLSVVRPLISDTNYSVHNAVLYHSLDPVMKQFVTTLGNYLKGRDRQF